MIIKWFDDAIYDLRALKQYISQENPSAANRVAKSILNSVNLLLEQPGLGRPGRVVNTRELVVIGTPYIIPYRIKNDEIELLRIFHSSMHWPENL